MADRYLLESGSPDGYQLEDGSGVLLLDDTTLEIVNNANTTVSYQGGGAYWVEKTSGAAAYDAGAVSNVGVAGDFVLRLLPIANTTDSMAGVNSDPLTDNTLSSIDFGFAFVGTTSASIYESGGFISTGNALSTYYWIWRTGTTLGYGTGADLATAQASPFRTTTSSATLYFDSALFTTGAKFEAYFYTPVAAVHDSSGTLTGQIGSVSGSAAHIAKHATSGTLTGQIGSVSGSAARTRVHATSGALTGQIGSVSGSSAHIAKHGTSGALTGQIGSVSGSAARFREIVASGSLVGSGAELAAAAARASSGHVASGVLEGQGAIIAGTASRRDGFDPTFKVAFADYAARPFGRYTRPRIGRADRRH